MKHLRLVLLLLFAGCAGTEQVPESSAKPEQILVPVFYVTDRNVKSDAADSVRYGAENADLSFGLARIGISTEKQGKSPYADRARWQPNLSDPKNKNEVLDVERFSADEFRNQLAAAASESGTVLVYVHGFSKTFETVARNTAIIAYEVNLQGTPILYSWPSLGMPAAYGPDLRRADKSVESLRRLLRKLAAEENIHTVHVLAHSLGNRALVQALLPLVDEFKSGPDWKFGEIILFAADLNAEVFERFAVPELSGIPSRVTLYVSGVDVPLRASRSVNQAERVGNAKSGIPMWPGFETIDVTPVATVLNGHSAHRDIAEIQADLYYLINERLGADERPTLIAVDTDRGRYWKASTTYLLEGEAEQ